MHASLKHLAHGNVCHIVSSGSASVHPMPQPLFRRGTLRYVSVYVWD